MSRIQNPGGGLQSRVLHLMVESRLCFDSILHTFHLTPRPLES